MEFIRTNKITPFNELNQITGEENSIFKTRDAKSIHRRVLTKIFSNFSFENTNFLISAFPFTQNIQQIEKRQNYFKRIKSLDSLNNEFLKELKKPKQWWKPKYDVLVITENEKTFMQLKELECPVKFITSREDLSDLDRYDLIQVIDCDEFSLILENLSQGVSINNIDDIYLERYLEILSGWEHNLNIIGKNKTNQQIQQITTKLSKLLNLISNDSSEKLSRQDVETAVESINQEIQEKIKELTISGNSLFTMLSKSKMPLEIELIINNAIGNAKIPYNVFTISIPVSIDEKELDDLLKRQNADEFTSIANTIQKFSKELKSIPEELEMLSHNLILFDFEYGIKSFILENNDFPEISENLLIEDSKNIFLEFAQPVSFHLNQENKCSILTGANSGGKTTLLEHIIQLISLFQLGLPAKGKVQMPIFSEIYYFAKTKGSANKGAFETLLTQMSKIIPGEKTLILADEIEAVTEPGVAGKIVSATADYFIGKGCFLIIATHLGQDIQKVLPSKTRIDGIEAKGLDENFNLIVDHNPVLGRLAHSTPELIVEKMASSDKTKTDYFIFLNEFLKKVK